MHYKQKVEWYKCLKRGDYTISTWWNAMKLLKMNNRNIYLLVSNVYSMFVSDGSILQDVMYPTLQVFFLNVTIPFSKH